MARARLRARTRWTHRAALALLVAPLLIGTVAGTATATATEAGTGTGTVAGTATATEAATGTGTATATADATLAAPAAPVVELYTMGMGDLVFEKFGHAALCIDLGGPAQPRCYNYGTTGFGEVVPLFWGFLRGTSRFWVSSEARGRMLQNYQQDDRTIWRQQIPVSRSEAIELSRTLSRVVRTDERYYQYHHFFDNCSTRVRDLIDQVTGGALRANAAASQQRYPTYREITRVGLAEQVPILIASDLLMGRAADHAPDAYAAGFLPDVLRAQVAAAYGAEPELVYQRRGPPYSTSPGAGGRWLYLVVALVVALPLLLSHVRGRAPGRWRLAWGAIPLGLLGLVVWTIAIASTLRELRWNEVLLVFMPLDLALLFVRARVAQRFAQLRVVGLLVVSLLLAIGVLVQPLWLLIPVPLLFHALVATPVRQRAR